MCLHHDNTVSSWWEKEIGVLSQKNDWTMGYYGGCYGLCHTYNQNNIIFINALVQGIYPPGFIQICLVVSEISQKNDWTMGCYGGC